MLDKQLRYHNVLPRCPLPPCAAAFHPHLKQALASSFRAATAERQAEPACPGVVHPIGVNAVSLEVGNSCVERMVLANTFIQTRPGTWHRVWLSYWTRSFKPRGQPCATGEVSTRLRVPIGHLGQEPVVAQCAPPLPPSTLRRSVSSAPQTGSCE